MIQTVPSLLRASALATAIAVFALANLVGGVLPLYVSASGLALAVVVYLSRAISPYLRVFVTMYALGYLLLASTTLLARSGALPPALAELVPPPFSASAAVAFALVVYGVSFIPVIRTITALADPYFGAASPSSEFGRPFAWLGRTEGQVGTRLVALMIAINMFQVAMQIRLNLWSRDLFDALQAKNADAFWHQIFAVFVPLATVWITVAVYEIFVDNSLHIRWRAWLTHRMTARWLDRGTHYRIPLMGADTDNPDQRIQADIRLFIDQTMSLSIRLLTQAATLVSFIIILWSLSAGFVVPGLDKEVPGFLVWLVIGYAVAGTWLTHLIGRPLIRLDFRQERVEADFRFALARLREYGEQVSLLRGERAELRRLAGSFGQVVANFLHILSRRMKLTTFTAGYSQLSVIFPYVLAAPSYFLGKITLGQFQQNAGAFNRVEAALSFFISAYTTLAAYKANVDRLTTFNASMSRAEAAGLTSPIDVEARSEGRDLTLEGLRLSLPDGRPIVAIDRFSFGEGQATLITGPSGSGKSTLMRAVAGIWPFGEGHVHVPAGRSIMLLPQRPYIPTGTLRAAVTYPGLAEQYDDARIKEALAAVKLDHLIERLDVEDSWGQHLSGGEQQRVSVARALLAAPDWLFMDEATAALDEPLEAEIYGVISERLPKTTVVSIGHRSTLVAMHDRQVAMQRGEGGLFALRDVTASVSPRPVPAAE